MKKSETAALLALAAIVDNRTVIPATKDQPSPTVELWHAVIGDLGFQDAVAALHEHRRTSTEYLMPAHIVALVDQMTSHRPPNITQERLQGLRQALAAAGVAPEAYEAARARMTDAELQSWLPASVRPLQVGGSL